MKAAVIYKYGIIEQNPLTIVNIDLREPYENEILVKVEACGVCHTDLHIVEGDLKAPSLPIIPGHQIVGRIVRVGEHIKEFRVGQRVGIPWVHEFCGKCRFCKRGNQNLCDYIKFTGFHTNGGFAEYILAKGTALYPLPENIDPVKFAPVLCGGVIGYRALKLAGVKNGERLGLVGFGSSAHIVLQIAIIKGIDVYVFSRSEEHRKHAESLGAKWTGTIGDKIDTKLDAIIVFAPVGSLMVESLKYLDKGGTLVSAGIHMSDLPAFSYDLIYYERKILSTANSTPDDVKEMIEIALSNRIEIAVTTYRLEEINLALKDIKYSKINGSAVITFD
ncbi:MAG: zinc-dependent alcohol dehydrogenase family protein [candidate division WOR-3 bacterium]